MMYDVAIIGGGASGLFCSVFLPKYLKKCIIEKTDKLGSKVLLSGGERCNLTNIYLDPLFHYVGQSLNALPSLFHCFGPEDMITYLHDHGIETVVEDNGRVLLKSGKAKQLVDFLIYQTKESGTDILYHHEVSMITIADDHSFVITTSVEEYRAKNIIVATGGMTYPQIGSSFFAYEIAQKFGLSVVSPHGALCGIETQENLSVLAGNTVQAKLTLYDQHKILYRAQGSLLFTHWGISGPLVFDASLYLHHDVGNYLLYIDFDLAHVSKKVLQFFNLGIGNTVRDLRIKALRPITEAKVSVGGILLRELDLSFQSKKIPGLYFIGEAVDITGKTGGYNLQRAWTSAYVCAKKFFVGK